MNAHPHQQLYDENNIFAQILKGIIKPKVVYEDEHVISFYDINPKTKIHVLVIPRGKYVNSFDFHKHGSKEEIAGYYRGLQKTIETLKITDEQGYRLISNAGASGGQQVFHFHTHILSGGCLNDMYVTQ